MHHDSPAHVGSRPVHVFTSRHPGHRDGFEFYAASPHDAVDRWAQQGVARVYIDGGALISQFLDAGLVDDLTLTVVPVLLGAGKPLFHRIATSTPLRLIDAKSFASGMAQLRYERA